MRENLNRRELFSVCGRIQGCAKQEIGDEIKDFVDDEVKIRKDEKEKDKLT